MKRSTLNWIAAPVFLLLRPGATSAADADTFSPVVSYQYQDSLTESGGQGVVTSPVASYQYFDWPGDENLTFTNTANVSYYYDGQPTILAEPNAQNVKVGDTVTFTVDAGGSSPLSYEWRLNGVPVSGPNDAEMPNFAGSRPVVTNGANDSSLTITNAQSNQTGVYSVAVGNTYGAAYSRDAQLYVFSAAGQIPTMPVSTPATLGIATFGPPATLGRLQRVNSSGVLEDLGGNSLPNKITIVLTHGWRSSPADWPKRMAVDLTNRYPDQLNIVEWDWQANANSIVIKPADAAWRAPYEGTALGKALLAALGSSFDQEIHFMGHSFGTLVNAGAANYLHGIRPGELVSNAPKFSPSKTHITLFDEAGIIQPFKGLFATLDDIFMGYDNASHVRQLHAEVLPSQAAYVDNYINEVGRLHSSAANVMLWRNWTVPIASDFLPILGVGLHGYPYEWYRNTVKHPTSSVQGNFWSFEHHSLYPNLVPQPTTFYLQKTSVGSLEMDLTQIQDSPLNNWLLEQPGLVVYPTYEAYLKLSAIGRKVQGAYLSLQHAGSVIANFIETFKPPTGVPVYSGTAGSTPAYFIKPPKTTPSNLQAEWDAQISMQHESASVERLQSTIPANRRAVSVPSLSASSPSPNVVFTIIAIHVPREAVAVSFEYQIIGSDTSEFLTMNLGDTNAYTMGAKYLTDGEWNGSPLIDLSELRDRDAQFVFALNGDNVPPTGMLSIRNIQFYIPPQPELDLRVENNTTILSWPLSAIDWTLEANDDLSNRNGWGPVNVAPADTNYFHSLTLDRTSEKKFFFRLSK